VIPPLSVRPILATKRVAAVPLPVSKSLIYVNRSVAGGAWASPAQMLLPLTHCLRTLLGSLAV